MLRSDWLSYFCSSEKRPLWKTKQWRLYRVLLTKVVLPRYFWPSSCLLLKKIISLALIASESIAHSAFRLMGYWLRTHLGARNNWQLVPFAGALVTQCSRVTPAGAASKETVWNVSAPNGLGGGDGWHLPHGNFPLFECQTTEGTTSYFFFFFFF